MLTRKDLREEVAQQFGFLEADVTGGNASVINSNDLMPYASDYWNGAWVKLFNEVVVGGGSEAGTYTTIETRRVVDFSTSGGYLLSVMPSFTVTPEAGDVFQLYQNVSPEEIDLAVKRASRGAEIATSLTPNTTGYDYQLTEAVGLQRRQQITGLWIRDQNLQNAMPRRLTVFDLEDAEGLLTLRIPFLLSSTDHFWLTYLADENTIDSDTDEVNLPSELIKSRAVVYLIEILLGRQGASGTERWGTMMRMWSDIRTEEERSYQSMPRRVKIFDWVNSAEVDLYDRLNIASKYA